MRISSVTGLALVLLAQTLSATDPSQYWPQWRGPELNGASLTAKNLPVRWSETENVVWRAELPSWSAATPIVWGESIFVTSAESGFSQAGSSSNLIAAKFRELMAKFNWYDDILLVAINRNDGSIRWQKSVGEGNAFSMKQNMGSPSPVTDGRHVWVMTGLGDLVCLDFRGKEIWKRNIQNDYGQFGIKFGYASSPVLHEGKLYLQVLHGSDTDDPSYVLAIDGASGKTLWKMERPTDAVAETPDSYATPTLVKADGETRLVIAGAGYVTGHDLASGKELWRAGGLDPNKAPNYRTIASATVSGNVIMAPSRGNPFVAFRAGGNGDVTDSHRLWSTPYGPDVPTPTTDGERLYIVDDKGIALCLRVSDGTTVWGRERLELGTYSASPLQADGKVYAINEEGATTVFEAGDEFKILSVNKLDGYTLASPIAAAGQIFIRTAQHLYCLGMNPAPTD